MLWLLVVGSAADALMSARPRHTQPRDELLRADLPKGFLKKAPRRSSSRHRARLRKVLLSRWATEAATREL